MQGMAGSKGATAVARDLVKTTGMLTPRRFNPEKFRVEMARGVSGIPLKPTQLLERLAGWIDDEDLPSLSQIYRWHADGNRGPEGWQIPFVAYAMGRTVEDITDPVSLKPTAPDILKYQRKSRREQKSTGKEKPSK